VESDLERKTRTRTILTACISIAIFIVLFFVTREMIGNVESITRISESAGVLGPIVLILLIALGILFTPIPSVVLIIASGYVYGTWKGAMYSYLGHLVAAVSIFAIVKAFGVHGQNKKYEKYRKLIRKNQSILYLLYIVPLLPVSLISLVSASSKIKWKRFIQIVFTSFIPPVLFFSFFGNRLNSRNLIEIGAFVIVIAITGIVMYKLIKKNSSNQGSE
jgi:uncharacterized membrane protein YdjX (TVP38/TMEM64 family)